MKKFAMALFGVFAFSASTQAAVFDFVAEAAGDERGAESIPFVGVDGHTITATGYDWVNNVDYAAAGTDVYNAYLDDVSGGKPGGLGVCKILAGTQCNPGSDDNVTEGEALRLDLSGGATRLSNFTFRDAEHDPVIGTDNVWYRVDEVLTGGINNDGWELTTFAGLSALVLSGSVIEIAAHSNTEQLYLSTVSTVPVPAAVWLFGTAMLGLFGMRRKAKMGAVAA